jgi:choline dehydrogenase-like flavoprotein
MQVIKRPKVYPVIVIASGTSGGMAAWNLTRKGVQVLMLDAGEKFKAAATYGWEFNQMHDVSNVFAVDGSSFASATEKNPTPTILALSWRATDYFADQMKQGVL